ncbi:MAG: diguanylate cyclase [Magnetospirillum sp.]
MNRGTDILIVEDSAVDIQILAELLTGMGSVSFAMTGADALAKLNEFSYDVVLLDVMLPDMSGFDICRQVSDKLRPGETSVLFVTALHEAVWEEQGLLLGALDYIVKPFSPPSIRARVRNHLTLARTTRELRQTKDKLERLATVDHLTGIFNRGHFEMLSERELERMERSHGPGCLLLLDLDHFKQINDTHGHAAGDQALMAVAKAWAGELRGCDILGRIGGEEFALFLPETDGGEAVNVAERLLRQTRALAVACDSGATLRLTTSIGGVWTQGGIDLKTLMRNADHMLYRAKQLGRDRVEMQGAQQED